MVLGLLGLVSCQESETTTTHGLAGGPPPGILPAGGPPPGILPAGGPPPGIFPAGGPPPGILPEGGLPSLGWDGPPDFLKDVLKNCPPEPPTVPDFNITAVRKICQVSHF